MARVIELFPKLVADVIAALSSRGRVDLADQLSVAEVSKVTFDAEADAGYVYLRAPVPPLVDRSIIGGQHGDTIPIGGPFNVNVDTSDGGEVVGLEILQPLTLRAELRNHAGTYIS